jgi:hypothetical protein
VEQLLLKIKIMMDMNVIKRSVVHTINLFYKGSIFNPPL